MIDFGLCFMAIFKSLYKVKNSNKIILNFPMDPSQFRKYSLKKFRFVETKRLSKYKYNNAINKLINH